MGDFNCPDICLKVNTERRRLELVNSLTYVNTWRKDVKMTKPGYSLGSSARARCCGHKPKYRRVHLNFKKHFQCKGDWTLTQVSGKCMRSSEASWTQTWTISPQWACLNRGLDQVSFSYLFHSQPFCDSVEGIEILVFIFHQSKHHPQSLWLGLQNHQALTCFSLLRTQHLVLRWYQIP